MHPLLGYGMLLEQNHPFSALAALLHHRFTKGYPEILPDPILPIKVDDTTISSARVYARYTGLADCYDAAKYRNNCHKSDKQRKRTSSEARDILLEENKDLAVLIDGLIKEGIFDLPLAA